MARNSQLKRALWHDYRSSCRYMITLSRRRDFPPLSVIEGDPQLPAGTRGSCRTRWSHAGKKIADLIYNMSAIHPALRADQYVVMPDHVHILLWVQSPLPEHLGFYIARFKNAVNLAAGENHVFEDGFNDQIVTSKRDLNTLFAYIRDNPRRLAVRRACPDFFNRRDSVNIAGHACMVYGNIHLLDNPFKEQVVVHRADSPEVLSRNKETWLYTAANGGVLVSPFISQAEKAIRNEAEASGGKIILITHEAFPDRYKPAAHDFELCTQGRLLIISLGYPSCTPLARDICLSMNNLAHTIAATFKSE